jgi:hypothetical protein
MPLGEAVRGIRAHDRLLELISPVRRLGTRGAAGGSATGCCENSVEFHLGHGDWIRLLRTNGFEVLDRLGHYRARAPTLRQALRAANPHER